MIITSEFKVDLFQLKHTSDPVGLLSATKAAYASELGRKLAEVFPYVKVDGYTGELPTMSLNKEHEFMDRYRTRFVVLSEEDADRLRLAVKNHSPHLLPFLI